MNSTFSKEEAKRGVITIDITKADYAEKMEQKLREVRKTTSIPGFRVGQAPKSFLMKKFGLSIKADAIDQLVGEELFRVIQENKVDFIGEPILLPSNQDLMKLDDLKYTFHLALMPEINVELSKSVKMTKHSIIIDDKSIDDLDQQMRQQYGQMVEVEKAVEDDSFTGVLVELDEQGLVKEGGLRVEEVMLLPKVFANDDEKKKFADANKGQVIAFNPFKADGEDFARLSSVLKVNKEEAEKYTGDFNYEIEKINHFEKAELGEEFYKKCFNPETEIKDEASYRAELKKMREEDYAAASKNLFVKNFIDFLKEKIGSPEIDDETFRPFVQKVQKEKEEGLTDDSYKGIVDYVLLSQTIKKTAATYKVEAKEEDVLEEMRRTVMARLSGFGYKGMPEELVLDIAKRQLEEGDVRPEMELNASLRLLAEYALENVSIEEKDVTIEEFDAFFETEK